jgi:hypothetical protein
VQYAGHIKTRSVEVKIAYDDDVDVNGPIAELRTSQYPDL